MPTYTFTSSELSRFLGETIRLFQQHRDWHCIPEAEAKPAAVRAVMALLEEEREVVLGGEGQEVEVKGQDEPARYAAGERGQVDDRQDPF